MRVCVRVYVRACSCISSSFSVYSCKDASGVVVCFITMLFSLYIQRERERERERENETCVKGRDEGVCMLLFQSFGIHLF